MERIAQDFVGRRRQLIRRGEAGRGRRYPPELVGMAVAFAELAATAGWSQRQIAERLELPLATLTRWCEAKQERDIGLHEVVLTPETGARAKAPREVVVVTPDGFRIEGLEATAIPPLLEALRR